MRLSYLSSLYLILILLRRSEAATRHHHQNRWGDEATGEESNLPADQQDTYKQTLLQYVFQTGEPPNLTDDAEVPYVMDKLYNLVADKASGEQRDSTPFSVDYIHGLEDYYESERRMQFWFNTSTINRTEDIIDCYFHIYKKPVPMHPGTPQRVHHVTVSLYKVLDDDRLYSPDGSVGEGAELLETQMISAYSSEWIIFRTNLKETVKHWTRNPSSNFGFLLAATDSETGHVNGTHIEFAQRGELPTKQQPVLVVYTDQERKKNNKIKKKHKSNIEFLVDNFLNEDARLNGQNMAACRSHSGPTLNHTQASCTELLLRKRRSVIDPLSAEEDNPRRRRRRQHGDLAIASTRRDEENKYCRKRPLYISFRALGWGKWIVAPEGLNANYCEGTCPFPLTSSMTASNHAVLQSVSNFYHPDQVKSPCCVPQKLARMSILYHQTDKVVTMRNYDDMMVQTCGCR